MSAISALFRAKDATEAEEAAHEASQATPVRLDGSWGADSFTREQIRGLVRRVFVPGWPRPAHQVVFGAADPEMDLSRICQLVGAMLASESSGRVCLVDANTQSHALEEGFGRTSNDSGNVSNPSWALRKSSRQIAHNLWFVPSGAFLGPGGNSRSVPTLQARLNELRQEFEYAVIHGGWAGPGTCTEVLAHLTDGMVLGVAAHRTRRIVAQKLREQLASANVRLLGIVLSERTFPIPEKLYKRL